MKDEMRQIHPDQLAMLLRTMKLDGADLAAIFCHHESEITRGDPAVSLELLYCFRLANQKMEIVCVRISAEQELVSACPVFPGTLFYENRIRDFYGIRFEGLEPDHGRRFLGGGR
ncbi:MAG TPA: hypothetical protein DD727_10080, partial [Clostridiales bacterium]|nr:hypothetical protein [Clostridiales bacterium]